METWSEVEKVQPLASRIITNSIKKGRISHAYLIQGERGTGKEAIALLLAKGLFCENKTGVEPCNICNLCKRITSGNHPDVHWIKPDGRSIRIEQIETLQKEFTYTGFESNQKVYVIVGSDTLTLNAANRILKFLEEPSKKTTAIMLTENSQSIIPTIRSRCQIIDLQPLNTLLFQGKLIELGMSKANATLMSALTNNLDEAFLLNEDEWFAQARKIVLQLIDIYPTKPADAFLFIHQHWIPHFKERDQQEQGLDLLLLAFKDMIYFYIDNTESMVVYTPNEDRLERAVHYFTQENLLDILHVLLKAKRKLKQNVHPTLVMEQLALHIQGRIIIMIEVIGVRFKKAGKIYYFDPGDHSISIDNYVIVETIRGIEFGKVVIANKRVDEEDVVLPLKKVIRIATEDDKLTVVKNQEYAKAAFKTGAEKIVAHKLEMKLVEVDYTLDRNKIIFYFTADGRIDFRNLVKDLAAIFKTRIELRQIGVRDEAKMLGGIGPCGRMLCCSTFLGDFEPVSIKMAKDQNLSLNPAKISGLCGRLMCCLKYENDDYEVAKRKLPDLGATINTPFGKGKVIGLNILERLVQIELPESERVIEYTLDELIAEGIISAQATE